MLAKRFFLSARFPVAPAACIPDRDAKSILPLMPIACMFALTIFVFAFGAIPAGAHPDAPPDSIQGAGGHDRPGPPPLLTGVQQSWVEYPYKLWSDDWGCCIEVTVTTAVQHTDHGYDSWSFSNNILNWNVDHGFWLVSLPVYQHLECSPMNSLRIMLSGMEADASNLSELEERMMRRVVELLVSEKYIIGQSIVLKLLRSFFAWVNPDDSLGFGEVTAGAPGVYLIDTAGGDYSIRGGYNVTAPSQNTNECNPETPIPEATGPDFGFSTARIDSLKRIYESVDWIAPEDGQSYLSPQDMDDARTSVRSLTVGMARFLAARMLEQAQPHYGFSSALYYFNQAETETGLAALEDYRVANYLAEYAHDYNGIDPNAAPMSPVIVALPSFMATRSGRSIEYVIGAFGTNAQSVSIANVSGGPPGATFSVQSPDPNFPQIQVLHVDQSASPGTYPIYLSFTGGFATTSAGPSRSAAIAPVTLTLDLDDPTPVVGVDDRPLPGGFALSEVRPNPITAASAVRVELPVEASVSLALFDVAGHRVRSVAEDQVHRAGTTVFRLDSQGLPVGMYYLRLFARPTGSGVPFRTMRSVVVVH